MAYFNRDYSSALSSLSGAPQARVHIELRGFVSPSVAIACPFYCASFDATLSRRTHLKHNTYLVSQNLLPRRTRSRLISIDTGQWRLIWTIATSAQSWLKALEQSQDKPEQLEAFPISWSEVSAGGTGSLQSLCHIISFLWMVIRHQRCPWLITLYGLRSLWHGSGSACLF